MHPLPEESKVVRADQLRIGTEVYSPNGWFKGPSKAYDGCWRRIIDIGEDPKSERDFWVKLEQFPGEPRSMVDWYDSHTLVIVRA